MSAGAAAPLIEAPGALLGLPPGLLDPLAGLGWLRLLLLLLGALSVAALARGRERSALLVAVLLAALPIGAWALALQRPAGLFSDPRATRCAAEASVAATGGAEVGGFVAGEVAGCRVWRGLVWLGVPVTWVQALPTLLPIAVLVGATLAIGLLWRQSRERVLAASLFALLHTGELTIVQGLGLATGIWLRPEAGVLLVALLLAALACGRLPRAAAGLGVAACAAGLALPPGPVALGWPDAILALVPGQGLLLLGLLAWRTRRDPAAVALTLGGAALVLAAPVLGSDPWLGLALTRCGLLLSLALLVGEWAEGAAEAVPSGWRLRTTPPRLVAAIAIAALLPASAMLRWVPLLWDPMAIAAAEPVSENLEPALAFIRTRTPPDAVFLASPAYSAVIAARAGRRVLRAQGLSVASDEAARVSAEGPLLRRWPRPERLQRWGVSYAFVAPGDFEARGVASPESLAERPGLERVYADAHRFHVYRLVGAPRRDP